MDNQKTLQIVMIALLIISTTMGILTYIALMSFTGGISFNPSSAFNNNNVITNNLPQLDITGSNHDTEPIAIFGEVISGAPTIKQVHECSSVNGHFECVSREVDRRYGVVSETCTKVACFTNK